MSDVLSITVPIEGAYASVNHTGNDAYRGGKKSKEYVTLFCAVTDAAEAEMARIGWTKATCECFTTIVRYLPDRRRADAMNLAKCEFDALTAAGAWEDDYLANPPFPWIRRDPSGHDRVSIVVVKLYESLGSMSEAKPKNVVKLPTKAMSAAAVASDLDAAVAQWKRTGQVPPGYAVLGNELITREAGLKAMRGGKS